MQQGKTYRVLFTNGYKNIYKVVKIMKYPITYNKTTECYEVVVNGKVNGFIDYLNAWQFATSQALITKGE